MSPFELMAIISIMAFLLITGCGKTKISGQPQKKIMPDLYYSFPAFADTFTDINEGLAYSLEQYSENPEQFGDPIAIIDSFNDSLDMKPVSRRLGLILDDPKLKLSEDFFMGNVKGGQALFFECRCSFDKLDSCWGYLAGYMKLKGYTPIYPGIEVFRGFPAENENDTSVVDLVIRVR